MKQKQLIIIFIALFLASCGTKEMQDLNIYIVFNKNIPDNPKDPMPDNVKSLLAPIEGEKIVYVPKITFCRLDLSKDSTFTFEMPIDDANAIRKKFGMYDYTNLKDDYDQYLPKLETGRYLTHPAGGNTTYIFQTASDDVVYNLVIIDKNSNKDTILKGIRDLTLTKKDIPKRVVIFYDNKPQTTQKPDYGQDVNDKHENIGNDSFSLASLATIDTSGNSFEGLFNCLGRDDIPMNIKTRYAKQITDCFTSQDALVIVKDKQFITHYKIDDFLRQIIISKKKVKLGKFFWDSSESNNKKKKIKTLCITDFSTNDPNE